MQAVASITHSNLHAESGISMPTGWALTPPPVPVNHALLDSDTDPHWGEPARLPFANFRRAVQQARFFYPRRGQPAGRVADEWVRLRGGQRWMGAGIGYVADMWPLPLEGLSGVGKEEEKGETRKFWYPTVTLDLDIKKALPEEGVEWLFARVETKQIRNGRMDIEVVILDEGGDLVALSHHVALVVSAERNIAARKRDTKI